MKCSIKMFKMVNARECPCVLHFAMSVTSKRVTISQRQEGNIRYDDSPQLGLR